MLHRCQNCGRETDLSNSLTAFEENPHCRQCGLSMSESDAKMQDELVSLMTRNLQLSNVHHEASMSTPPTPQVVAQNMPITYISQHYTHSAHVTSAISENPASVVLAQAGVNVGALQPNQIQLFRHAQPEQQQRLIELWMIAPPAYDEASLRHSLYNWRETTMDEEEAAARHRWEVSAQDRMKSIGAPHQAEPYIIHGYENYSNMSHNVGSIPTPPRSEDYSHSTDPAYNSREWWKLGRDEPVEYQYGMLQQMRDHEFQSQKRSEDHDMS